MPKYFQEKVAGYYLYFTSHCIIEAMHVHASDKKLTESGSAKFFVKADGNSEVADRGSLTEHELSAIQKFISRHYLEMYELWSKQGGNDFYRG